MLSDEILEQVKKDRIRADSDEGKKLIKYKNDLRSKMWKENLNPYRINFGKFFLEIGLYTGADKNEFKRSMERVYREICFKHTSNHTDYLVPIEKALKYHSIDVKLIGRASSTNMNSMDDYFIVGFNNDTNKNLSETMERDCLAVYKKVESIIDCRDEETSEIEVRTIIVDELSKIKIVFNDQIWEKFVKYVNSNNK